MPCSPASSSAGLDPIIAIRLGGLAAVVLAIPTAFFVFRLQGAYFAIGTWVIAEVVRLLLAQWKALGGGTGTSLPRDATRDMLGVESDRRAVRRARSACRATSSTYWLALVLAVVTIGFIYWLLRSRQGLGAGRHARQPGSRHGGRRRCARA